MDGDVKIIFVEGNSVISRFIQNVTGGQWSHLGIIAFDGIVEAVPPRVTISSALRYRNYFTETVSVHVSDIDAANAEIRALLERKYGFIDGILGVLRDWFKIKTPFIKNRTINCCELAVRTIRAGGGVLRPEIPADCFTPQSLYAAIKLSKF